MIGALVRLQLASWWREGRILGLLVGVVVVLLAATVWSTASDVAQHRAQESAAAEARADWLERGAEHPHRRAHYGDFAFRPAGPLARLDRGVQAQLGKVLRIEAHRQSTPLHSDASRAGTVARFERPDAAFLLQLIVPLLLLFLGSTGLAADRDAGRLKLSLVQGMKARDLVLGHFLALWGLGLLLVGVVALASLGTSLVADGLTRLPWERLAGFLFVHALFLAVVAAATVAAALWTRTARTALLILLALWIGATAFLPRAAGSAATALHPLPSQDAFQAAMEASREAGPDGHNPEDAAIEKRKKEVLAEYGVASTKELPIDFGGIAMQMDEDFGNAVWDTHYGELREQFARQQRVMTVAAVFNPYQAVSHLSTALAGTDLAHDLDFQLQAETYRRDLVRKLNHEHAYGGPETREGPWQAQAAFYEGLAAFEYGPPPWYRALGARVLELIGLGGWALLLLLFSGIGAARIARGDAAC